MKSGPNSLKQAVDDMKRRKKKTSPRALAATMPSAAMPYWPEVYGPGRGAEIGSPVQPQAFPEIQKIATPPAAPVPKAWGGVSLTDLPEYQDPNEDWWKPSQVDPFMSPGPGDRPPTPAAMAHLPQRTTPYPLTSPELPLRPGNLAGPAPTPRFQNQTVGAPGDQMPAPPVGALQAQPVPNLPLVAPNQAIAATALPPQQGGPVSLPSQQTMLDLAPETLAPAENMVATSRMARPAPGALLARQQPVYGQSEGTYFPRGVDVVPQGFGLRLGPDVRVAGGQGALARAAQERAAQAQREADAAAMGRAPTTNLDVERFMGRGDSGAGVTAQAQPYVDAGDMTLADFVRFKQAHPGQALAWSGQAPAPLSSLDQVGAERMPAPIGSTATAMPTATPAGIVPGVDPGQNTRNFIRQRKGITPEQHAETQAANRSAREQDLADRASLVEALAMRRGAARQGLSYGEMLRGREMAGAVDRLRTASEAGQQPTLTDLNIVNPAMARQQLQVDKDQQMAKAHVMASRFGNETQPIMPGELERAMSMLGSGATQQTAPKLQSPVAAVRSQLPSPVLQAEFDALVAGGNRNKIAEFGNLHGVDTTPVLQMLAGNRKDVSQANPRGTWSGAGQRTTQNLGGGLRNIGRAADALAEGGAGYGPEDFLAYALRPFYESRTPRVEVVTPSGKVVQSRMRRSTGSGRELYEPQEVPDMTLGRHLVEKKKKSQKRKS